MYLFLDELIVFAAVLSDWFFFWMKIVQLNLWWIWISKTQGCNLLIIWEDPQSKTQKNNPKITMLNHSSLNVLLLYVFLFFFFFYFPLHSLFSDPLFGAWGGYLYPSLTISLEMEDVAMGLQWAIPLFWQVIQHLMLRDCWHMSVINAKMMVVPFCFPPSAWTSSIVRAIFALFLLYLLRGWVEELPLVETRKMLSLGWCGFLN